MNISKEQSKDLSTIIKIEVAPDDYRPRVEEVIRKYQRTAQIPGFRPGKVPVGMIKKQYGRSVLLEELNSLTSNALYQFIADNKIDVIGNPLPTKSEKEMILEDGESFELLFEVGMAPQIEVNVTSKDKLPYYIIKVDDKMVDDDMADLRRRHGKFSSPEISSESNVLYGDFEELDETGNPKAEGNKTTTTLSIEMVKDAIEKNRFVGLKKGDTVTLNPMKVFGNEAEVSAILKLEKGSPSMHSDYLFTVKTINQIDAAELNQELFDKVYGEGIVNSEEEFRTKIKEGIASYFERESDKKLRKDLKNYLLSRMEIPLPDDFLKRMIRANMKEDEQVSDQEFEHQYFHMAEDLRWDLIRNQVAKMNSLEVTAEEITNMAAAMVRQQLAQYGMYDIEESRMKQITDDYINKEGNAGRLEKSILDDKVFRQLKSQLKLDVDELNYADFTAKLMEKTQHEMEHHH
ncbi:MAG: trigger factor [Bacteroidetes bacterium]|nr:trigger factor [Bacteroidota bacterium]